MKVSRPLKWSLLNDWACAVTLGQARIGRIGDRRVGVRVGRAGQDVAAGIDQLDHDVQAVRRAVDVDPDLACRGSALKLYTIDVARPVVRDRPVDLEAQPAVVVARLFVAGPGCPGAAPLRRGVGVDVADVSGLLLQHLLRRCGRCCTGRA